MVTKLVIPYLGNMKKSNDGSKEVLVGQLFPENEEFDPQFQDEKRSLSEPPRDMVEDWKESGVGALDEKIFLGWSDDDNWGNDEGLNEEDLRVGFSHWDLTSCLDGLLRYGQGVPNQGFKSTDPRNYIIYNIKILLSSFWPVICHRLFDEAIPDQMWNISDVPPDVLLLICDYLVENPIGQTGYVNHKLKYKSTKQLYSTNLESR